LNHIDIAFIVGLAAGTLTTLSFIPQILKSWRTKSTKDLSLAWLLTLFFGVLFWVLYGYLINEVPIMLANGIGIFLISIGIYLKLKYK